MFVSSQNIQKTIINAYYFNLALCFRLFYEVVNSIHIFRNKSMWWKHRYNFENNNVKPTILFPLKAEVMETPIPVKLGASD